MANIETLLAQAGLSRTDAAGSMNVPIYQSATFRHPALGQSTGFDYTRSGNPTRQALEECIALLEHGNRGFAFASGMAALTAVLSIFTSGDHFVLSEDLYGGTYRLLEEVFSRFGFTATFTDTTDSKNINASLGSETKAVIIETPSNPMMKITDIRSLAETAHKKNILLIVDNTFMTPLLQRPIELGADIVVHSGTKYLGGHNDVLSGFVVARNAALAERIGYIQNATGGVLSPQDSWLMLRGIKTLSVRMERAQNNARRIALWLLSRPEVSHVYYPDLPAHPGRELHFSQASGAGAMISFRVTHSALAEKIINRVRLISFAESLGGVESLITYPIVQTHASIPEDIRIRTGISGDLLRLSVGIENVEDLIEDLLQAIEGEDTYEI